MTGTQPRLTADNYRLSITGMVDQPAEFTLADLNAMPQTELVRDFQCVTGWRVPQVRWSGVALPDLLDRARPKPGVGGILFTSWDGTYTETLSTSQARRRDVLVATGMLDGAVTPAHGGPARLYVASMYGYKSLKWLAGIDLVNIN